MAGIFWSVNLKTAQFVEQLQRLVADFAASKDIWHGTRVSRGGITNHSDGSVELACDGIKLQPSQKIAEIERIEKRTITAKHIPPPQ